MTTVKKQQKKKLDGLIFKKTIQDCVQNSSNILIINLIGKTLLDTEIEVLKYDLKHGVATRLSEVGMIVTAENIWNQTEQKWLCNHYIDIYDKQCSNDEKKINVIKQLCEKHMILKPDKGKWVVIMNKVDYHDAMNRFFMA